jgi:hypothetical protein
MRCQVALGRARVAREIAEHLDFHVGQVVRPGAQAALLGRAVQMHDRVHAFEHLGGRRRRVLVDIINFFSHNG